MIIIIRQILFIFMFLFSEGRKETLELTILIILFFSLVVYLNCLPRMSKQLNFIEFIASLAYFFTSCFLYFFTRDITTVFKYVLILLVAVLHCIFLGLISYQLFREILKSFKKMISTILSKINSKKEIVTKVQFGSNFTMKIEFEKSEFLRNAEVNN